MDPLTRALLGGAAGASGGPKIYVEDVFSTWLYTGNGSTQTITNGIDLSGKGGLTWLKGRNVAYNNVLVDTATGAGKYLRSNSTIAQGASSGYIDAFTSSGFTLGSDSDVNQSSKTYASWTFRKAAKFFDVVTWTGNGSNRTIAHSLGSVPGCIIVKRTDASSSWVVYHRSLPSPESNALFLNLFSSQGGPGMSQWNSTNPTSSVFSVDGGSTVNANGGTYVAYLFAHDAGGFGDSGNDSIVSCGAYTGNGSATGPVVTLGWEPQWLMIKRTDSTGDWQIIDTMRGWSMTNAFRLRPNTSDSEAEWSAALAAILPNGFQIASSLSQVNASGGNYIYIAIRRGPMKTPTDATKVFAAALGASATPAFTSSFPVDLAVTSYRSGGGGNHYFADRLRGQRTLESPSTAVESATSSLWKLDQQTGFAESSGGWGSTHVCNMFRRAPGFFDVVAYTGSNSVTARNHVLGVIPQIMIIKGRSGTSRNWYVYHKDLGNNGTYDYELLLNTADAQNPNGQWLVSNRPTATTFTNNSFAGTNGAGETYIAYLFASCPGVSKVGSYTGTGTTLNIDCGFTNGARFVLIKRTDSTGDWYVWDTARGIVSGNDSYLLLNSTAAEVTNTDYIDPLSSGFQISSTAPAAINANGGSFIYLAVA